MSISDTRRLFNLRSLRSVTLWRGPSSVAASARFAGLFTYYYQSSQRLCDLALGLEGPLV